MGGHESGRWPGPLLIRHVTDGIKFKGLQTYLLGDHCSLWIDNLFYKTVKSFRHARRTLAEADSLRTQHSYNHCACKLL